MTTTRTDYADGTYLDQRAPWGTYIGGAALCEDGTVRRLKRIAQTADTFYSVPASVAARGRTVAGFVTITTRDGYQTWTTDDPPVVKFTAYRYRANADAITTEPAGDCTPTHDLTGDRTDD